MSYSVTDFIKRNCKSSYDINQLDILSEKMNLDSNERYSITSSKKILCRYITVKDGKIYFDTSNRNVDQTFEDVQKRISTSKSSGKKGFGCLKNINLDDDKSFVNSQSNSVKKGFGCLSNINFDNNETEKKSYDFNNNDLKTNNSKKRGFGFFNMSDFDNNDNTNEKKSYDNKFTISIQSKKNDTTDDIITSVERKRQKQYQKLASRYYPAQRSQEWFELRDCMITASDGGTIVKLNPYEPDFSFILKKVFGKPFETSIDCYHGKKFEQIATMIYEYRENVKVKEFGLCQHPKYKFLGASPDGIVSEYKLQTKSKTWEELEEELALIEDHDSKKEFLDNHCYKTNLVGRMLEIKCPMRRKIIMDKDAIEVYGPHGEKITNLLKDVKKGICPAYYWVQVQLQLQCCELDECDFWQCEIVEYSDRQEFIDDSNYKCQWLSNSTNFEKGVLIQLMPIENLTDKKMDYDNRIYNYAQFIYQPRINMTNNEIDFWLLNTIANLKETHKGMVFESVKYWRLNASRNTTIKRDDLWFKTNLSSFEEIWKKVEYFRKNKRNAKLIKAYIESQPKDRYGKVKDVHFDSINEIIGKIFNEPSENDTQSKHNEYAKFILNLEKKYITDDETETDENDFKKDIEFIIKTLEMNTLDEKKKNLVKLIKEHVDEYIFDD